MNSGGEERNCPWGGGGKRPHAFHTGAGKTSAENFLFDDSARPAIFQSLFSKKQTKIGVPFFGEIVGWPFPLIIF